MNFLSHHSVARRLWSDGAPEYYVGNLLPDLSGGANVRLRPEMVTGDDKANDPLVRGIRLHFAADQRFHALPAFKEASSAVQTLLKTIPFSQPPRRLFFVAHVFVEIALDAAVLAEEPDMAEDLYARFAAADLEGEIPVRAAALSGQDTSELGEMLTWFLRDGYLRDYAHPEGCVAAMRRVERRVGLANFAGDENGALLAGAFRDFAAILAPYQAELLAPP